MIDARYRPIADKHLTGKIFQAECRLKRNVVGREAETNTVRIVLLVAALVAPATATLAVATLEPRYFTISVAGGGVVWKYASRLASVLTRPPELPPCPDKPRTPCGVQGLVASVLSVSSDREALSLIRSDRVDAAVMPLDVALATSNLVGSAPDREAAQPAPALRVVWLLPDVPLRFLVPQSSTARVMKDLDGKKIGFLPEREMLAAALVENQDISNPTLVPLPRSAILDALAMGLIDAAIGSFLPDPENEELESPRLRALQLTPPQPVVLRGIRLDPPRDAPPEANKGNAISVPLAFVVTEDADPQLLEGIVKALMDPANAPLLGPAFRQDGGYEFAESLASAGLPFHPGARAILETRRRAALSPTGAPARVR